MNKKQIISPGSSLSISDLSPPDMMFVDYILRGIH